MTTPGWPLRLTVADSDVALIAVGFQYGAVIVDVVEEGERIATMSLEQYITNDPQITADFIPGVLVKLRQQQLSLKWTTKGGSK